MNSTINRFILVFFTLFLGANSSILAQTKKIDSLIVALENTKSDVAKIPILRELSKAFTTVDVDKKFIYANQSIAS